MNRDVIDLVALNEILRFVLRGVVDVAFESHAIPVTSTILLCRGYLPISFVVVKSNTKY